MIINMEIIADLFFLVLALAYGAGALSLPEAMFGNPWEPRLYPLIISSGIIILSIILLTTELRKIRVGKGSPSVKFSINQEERVIGLVVILSLIYTAVFDFLGYAISTFIFLEIIMLYISKGKKMLWPTVIALMFSVGLYYIFSRVLGITLPPGRILPM